MITFDERAFIAKVEALPADEFTRLLQRPSRDQERALRQYLGDPGYERMHARALRQMVARGVRAAKGNVVVLHGIMGGELTAFGPQNASQQIWVKIWRIVAGQMDRLRLRIDGQTGDDPAWSVRATGIIKRYYGDILLSLGERWNVQAFWYDWRRDLNAAAAELSGRIATWFPNGAPVHLVAHSMGGLVARTFIMNNGPQWKAMAGRLVMLGTPNHGAFVVPQVVAGLEPLVRKLAAADLNHDVNELRRILATFPGMFQMLPSPFELAEMKPLYETATWDVAVPQACLDAAGRHHAALRKVVDPARMIYVAGCNQPTLANLSDPTKYRDEREYAWTRDGDGRVTHALGRLRTAAGKDVPTYYVEEEHGALPANEKILGALDDLLIGGETDKLSETVIAGKRGAPSRAEIAARRAQDAKDEQQLCEHTRRMRAGVRAGTQGPPVLSPDEKAAENLVVRGFLGSGEAIAEGPAPMKTKERARKAAPARIEVRIVPGLIEDVHKGGGRGEIVDAIAVGHYLGVRPQAAELALDRSISVALPGHRAKDPDDVPVSDLLLTQYTDRGILRGELGTPFVLPDPRAAMGRRVRSARVIAVAGMGVPARFGSPELVVLVRELCWTLGRLGRRHLASVLIGSGNGNLGVREAMAGWVRGLRAAHTGSQLDERRRLRCITFVEHDPRRRREMDEALVEERLGLRDLDVKYTPLTAAKQRELSRAILKWDRDRARRAEKLRRQPVKPVEPTPTRITLTFEGTKYRYGALTDTASIPERELELKPLIVDQINQSLVTAGDVKAQHYHGANLGQFIFPAEFRESLRRNAPVVMLLDTRAAQVHWEMVGRPGEVSLPGPTEAAQEEERDAYLDALLGTSGGLTRQLRTTFAPPPEPPPPPRRTLKVLVVADPAAQAHLPGAEEEGMEVADLFERFNAVVPPSIGTRTEVVRLFGPSEATFARVMEELLGNAYDVLHFAGHCFYNADDPPASGWLFTDDEILTARELNRIDRVPKFVFSNACESGITPDRSELRNAAIAPSFAEAFFGRGVANFVCTAWPVDDKAAREFARRVYGGLLGLDVEDAAGTETKKPPVVMHKAMRAARRELAKRVYGVRTWGAYQHYGNPFFSFFETAPGEDITDDAGGPRRRAKPRRPRPAQPRTARARR